MLCLGRNIGERIIIGEGENAVAVMLLEVRDKTRVRLAIDAPSHMRVDRAEITAKRLEWSGKTPSEIVRNAIENNAIAIEHHKLRRMKENNND